MLAAYDAAARSGQAGAPKEVNFEAFKKADGKSLSVYPIDVYNSLQNSIWY